MGWFVPNNMKGIWRLSHDILVQILTLLSPNIVPRIRVCAGMRLLIKVPCWSEIEYTLVCIFSSRCPRTNGKTVCNKKAERTESTAAAPPPHHQHGLFWYVSVYTPTSGKTVTNNQRRMKGKGFLDFTSITERNKASHLLNALKRDVKNDVTWKGGGVTPI